jgi:tetratricopeptide (TPR) repeat protein
VDIPTWLEILDYTLTDGAGVKHAVRGHSYIMTAEEIIARRDYIKQVWNAVVKTNSEGMTPDQILTRIPLENFEYITKQFQRKLEDLKRQHERIVKGYWRQLQGKLFATEILLNIWFGSDLDSLINKYKSMTSNRDKYYFDEDSVNSFAYALIEEGNSGKAWELLNIHLVIFPESARAHSLLGDAYMADGKREEGIKAYTKALSINPSDKAIKGKLEKAKASKKLQVS